MSHWIKAETKCSNRTILVGALSKMGISVLGENQTVATYGNKATAELVIGKNHSQTPVVGMARQENGNYSMIGDPYYATQESVRKFYGKTQQFQQELQKNYCVIDATTRLESEGFTIEENSEGVVNEQGKIQMLASRYV